MAPDKLRLCYVLAYRDPTYIRTRTLLSAIGGIPGVRLLLAMNKDRGLRRYLQTFLALRQLQASRPQAYLLGFRGHEIALFLYAFTRNKPVIFDAMMSPWAALHEERKAGRLGQFFAYFWKPLERYMLRRADWVLTDTSLHAAFYIQEFGIPQSQVITVPVGAIEPQGSVPLPSIRAPQEPLRLLFYGSFLPLHGVPVIVQAASLLLDLPVIFDFIGGTKRQARKLHEVCAQLGIINYTYRPWVSFDKIIAEEIPKADLCLGGPFGGTMQGQRVVTGKTLQSLALGRVTIVGEIGADNGFRNRENCLLVQQGSPRSLAEAIRWAHENRDQLPTIAARGRALYAARFSVDAARKTLMPLIYELQHRAQPRP